jgi:uncharacterized protein involved in exopolysaccharide biosynthesis
MLNRPADSSPGDYSPNEYSVRDFLTILFKHRRMVLTFFVAVLVVVALGSFLMPPTYEVTATILVKKARAEIPLAAKESAQLIINQLTEEELNSKIEILKGRQLIEEVLENLGVDESWRSNSVPGATLRFLRGILGATPLSYFDELVLHLEQELDISAIRKSNIIQVSYRSKDPDWATQVVKTLTELYLERRTQVYQSPQAVSFFDEQTQAAQERLTNAERALELYLGGTGLTMLQAIGNQELLSAQKETVLQKLAQFERELGEVQVVIGQHEDRIAALKAQLARRKLKRA